MSYINNYLTVTPTLSAFAACLRHQLATVQSLFLELRATRAAGMGPPLTLLELHVRLGPALQHMAVLYHVLEATLPNGMFVLWGM